MIPQYTERKEEMKNINILKQTDIKYFTPNNCNNYAGYGGCYYYKVGSRVHLHIGVSVNTTSNILIGTLSEQYRPITPVSGIGLGASLEDYSAVQINEAGLITINSKTGYALIDLKYDTLN